MSDGREIFMHKLSRRVASVAASAVMAVCTLNVFPAFSAEEAETITVHFDMSDPDISIAEDEDGNVPELNDIVTKPISSVLIPNLELEQKGKIFVGWTADGVYGLKANSVFRTSGQDITLTPVFAVHKGEGIKAHYCTYEVDFGDGNGVIDTSKDIPREIGYPNDFIKVSFMSYQNEQKKSTGWTDGEHNFLQEQYMIMPDHDVVLTPIWHNRLTFSYYAGDYDDIVGATRAEFDVIESQKKDVADTSRFARIGYKIDHWHCDYDDQDYAPLSSFVIPDAEVTMTAVWVPVEYNVVFKTGISGVPSIKVPGKTGDTIKVPELDAVNEGYTFGGWTLDGETYQSGDDFLIKGAMPGVGIALTPVWIKEGEEPAVTTTTTAPATTTTTTAPVTTAPVAVTTLGDLMPTPVNIVKTPDKLSYVKNSGEKLDLTGMIVSIGGIDPEAGADQFHLLSTLSESEDIAYFYIVDDSDFDITKAGTYTIRIGKNSINTFTVEVVEEAPSGDIKYGDANCDTKVDLSDAVLIMQSLANPSKYKLTEEGKKNADVSGGSDGITASDALAIQKYMLKLIDKLPEEAAAE